MTDEVKAVIKTAQHTQTVTLATESITEILIDGQKTLFAIVPTDAFLHTDIPNKANSRDYTGEKNKSVPEMIKTLNKQPELFRVKNLGIRLVASEYVRDEKNLTLYFGPDEGIFNGGHTYTVLQKHGRRKAYVNVNIDIGLPKDDLVEISLSLNMSKKLEQTSQGEKRGAFDWIKKVLPEESIRYKEGDTGEHDVGDILKVANLFKIGKGRKYTETGLTQSLRNKSLILRENNEKQLLSYTSYLLPELWELYKNVRVNEAIQKALPDKFAKKGVLLQGIALCFVAGIQYATEINRHQIPRWKNGYGAEKALKLCEEAAVACAKELRKPHYKEMKAEAIYKDSNFQRFVMLTMATSMH